MITAGAIFDMDGVLIDSGEAHFEAFRRLSEKLGAFFSEEFFRNGFGLHHNELFPMWLGPLTAERLEELAAEKENIYRSLAESGPPWVEPMPGALDLVRRLKDAGWRISVGSSGPRANVDLAIRILGIEPLLDCSISGNDVERGKPDPAIFLMAAQKMGLPPSQCVVFEDAVAGVEAALRAGMKCVAITTSMPAEKIKAADRVIHRFEEIQVPELNQLIRQ